MPSQRPDPLEPYRAKRSLGRTPEPAGTVDRGAERALLFVVHKHAARHLHFDLRLEMEGVLRSWAVPKGPSLDPADKRLAVHVEDHPIEYGDFEGLIPEGNYGAGAVVLWDRGRWVPHGDPMEGLAKGKLLFELKGFKLRGMWTLVKIKKSERDWLLIKERDQYVRSPGTEFPEGSVLSGLTVEDLKAGNTPAEGVRRELANLRAPARPVKPDTVELMLAETTDKPFSRPGWVFELKLDGYRILAAKEGPLVRLLSRNGNDLASSFPEIVRAVSALPSDRVVLDGEIVTPDDAGRPSFQRLQGRARLRRSLDVRRAAVETPATFYAFDLIGFEEFDLRSLPLFRRKALLERIVPPAGVVRYLEHFERDGEALYERVQGLGLEGVVGKKADSPYRGGRSASWQKVRTRKTDEFVVVGFTAPKGTREGFGALHLAQYVDGKLIYSGRAGSGFSGKQLAESRRELEGLKRKTPACEGPVPKDKGTTWVEPEVVCEVEYTEWTDEGLLRQPVFVRFRDDKRPTDVTRSASSPNGNRSAGDGDAADTAVGPEPGPVERQVVFSNLGKVFWPEERYTKGDLIEYYRTIAPWLLPYLKDRPVVLTRYPDGIEGKSFYQKDAPVFVPQWIRTQRMWSEQTQREIDYFICDDIESLLYLANLAAIPLHVWASRVPTLDRPDWCVLDLDPKGAPFEHVVQVAKATRKLCDEIDLPCFVKTSGSSGLHVLLPLGRQCTYEQSRSLGELLARVLVSSLPDISTITRAVSRRGGKVYVDYLQNIAGQLLAAPFSVRPLPGAPVSTPLEWREVNERLDIRAFTIRTMPERMKKRKTDPLRDVLDLTPDLGRALERLAAKV
ncbi:MAG TPA: DNA ligase D [Gemmatimonadales bacterium]|nr:DNA ligase D [Gemmatimonadales bacterium]